MVSNMVGTIIIIIKVATLERVCSTQFVYVHTWKFLQHTHLIVLAFFFVFSFFYFFFFFIDCYASRYNIHYLVIRVCIQGMVLVFLIVRDCMYTSCLFWVYIPTYRLAGTSLQEHIHFM